MQLNTREVAGMAQDSGLRTYRDAVAIVTGAASGIGCALSRQLAQRGAHVVLADLQDDVAEQVAAEIRQAGGSAESRQLNVTDFEAVAALVNDVAKSRGRLDYIFNNAGIAVLGEAKNYEIRNWNSVLDVNLRGVIHGVQTAYQVMIPQGFGHIVNTASITGLVPMTGLLSYATTKHAVVGLSNALRVEAEELGIRVTVLCPGAIETAIVGGGKFGQDLRPVSKEVQRQLWERLHPISAEECARQALEAVARNKAIAVIPKWWKGIWRLYRLSPNLGLRLARKYHQEGRKNAEKLRAAATQ
jgi:NAD(P)-dependent dehydrogenase (short-subunit alcohol dehydrogenase family)